MILSAVSARDEMRELLFLFPSRGQGGDQQPQQPADHRAVARWSPQSQLPRQTRGAVIITPPAGIVLYTESVSLIKNFWAILFAILFITSTS